MMARYWDRVVVVDDWDFALERGVLESGLRDFCRCGARLLP
jgi:hypothetical protein